MKLHRIASSLTAATLLASLSTAQDRAIEADMEFARGLATRFSYVDLAEEILTDLDGQNLSGKNAEGLALLKCEVYAAGATGETRDKELRYELFDKAMDAYQAFLAENEYSDYLPSAQKNYVTLVNNYGRILEMDMAELVGPERAAVREKIKEVIDAGLDLTGDLISETEGASTSVQKLERWRLMLNRGQMMLTLASVSEDGSFLFSRAESTLEELALEAGEYSGPGLNAFLMLARAKIAQGLFEDAVIFSTFVYDAVLPTDPDMRSAEGGWNDLSFEEKVPRWQLGELALDVCVEALLGNGQPAEAAKYALSYYGDYRREGFTISPFGYLSLLAGARALLEAGGGVGIQGRNPSEQKYFWFESVDAMESRGFQVGSRGANRGQAAIDLALSIAQTVNTENKKNVLQRRAQKLISQIIERPGVKVDPDILYEAAEGDYNDRNYPRAVASFKGILRQLEGRDQATQQEYAPRVLYYIGRSLSRMDRNLEAAMAYREAVKEWSGDPENDQRVAQGYYESIRAAKKSAGDDPLLQEIFLDAEEVLRQLDQGGGAIAFRQAERAYAAKDYPKARSLYQQVEKGTPEHEKAIVMAALCLMKQKDYANARKELEDYLTVYVEDPRNAVVDATLIAKRGEAKAQATYNAGYIAFLQKDYDGAIGWLESFARTYPDQDSYGPAALQLSIRSFLQKNDVASSRRVLAEMREKFPTSSATGNAGRDLSQAIEAERDKAEAAGDAETVATLEAEMADYVHLFNQLSPRATYGTRRQESELWISLGKWAEAEAVLRDIQTKDADRDDLGKFALPDLGLALLEQKKINDAFAVLDPLVPKSDDDERKPSSRTVLRWCRAVTGWLEGDDRITEVPGVGGAERLELAADLLDKLTKAEGTKDKYTAPWYALKFETIYAYYQWGKEDSARTKTAASLITNLQDMLGNTRMNEITEASDGDDTLRKRFLWLQKQVK